MFFRGQNADLYTLRRLVSVYLNVFHEFVLIIVDHDIEVPPVPTYTCVITLFQRHMTLKRTSSVNITPYSQGQVDIGTCDWCRLVVLERGGKEQTNES